MINRFVMVGLALSAAVATTFASPASSTAPQAASRPPAEFVADRISVAELPKDATHRIYLSDLSISHFADGKLHIIDGDSLKYLGIISTGLTGQSTLSPDRSEIYVATTYYPKLNRGERGDELDIYDAHTLKLKAEIPLPPKHAQALPYKGVIATSHDGRFIFVQNATPATSVSIVDRQSSRFVSEVTTPGCWIIIPAPNAANRFSTLCGDGTLLTITLDDKGQPVQRKRSPKFFNPDLDPIFVHTERIGNRHYFVSFQGLVHEVDLGSENAVFTPPWPLFSAADNKRGWRPGGYQPLAVHAGNNRLYVAVHPHGKEGSHKEPAKEIRAYDLASKKLIQRVPGHNAIAIAVSGDQDPRLIAFDGLTNTLVAYQAADRLKLHKRLVGVGESPTLIELH